MPDWMSKLEFLVQIRLVYSNLKDDSLRSLEKLQNMLKLTIWDNSYDDETLHFESGGFPKLKELYLARLNRVNSVMIEKKSIASS